MFRNISGNPLACDCNLLWLIPWSSNMSVKLQPPPKCETPSAFRGLLVKKLKVGQDLHCDTPLQPLLELKPDQDQVSWTRNLHTFRIIPKILMFNLFPVGIRRWSPDTAMSSTSCCRWLSDRFRRLACSIARLLGLVWTNPRAKLNWRHQLSWSTEKVSINWDWCTSLIGQWTLGLNFDDTVCYT